MVFPWHRGCDRGCKPRRVPAPRPVAGRPHCPGAGLQPAWTPSSGHRTWRVTRHARSHVQLLRLSAVLARSVRPTGEVRPSYGRGLSVQRVRSVQRARSVRLSNGRSPSVLHLSRQCVYLEGGVHLPGLRASVVPVGVGRAPASPPASEEERSVVHRWSRGLWRWSQAESSFAFLVRGHFYHKWVLDLVKSCGFCPFLSCCGVDFC